MLKNYRTVLFIAFILLSVSSVYSQNKFEGYSLFLDAPDTQKVQTCALRYASPQNAITITDLDRSTPMKVTGCDQTTRVTQSGATATLRADASNAKWCFNGEDKRYRITFQGDQSAGQITYDWIATPETPGIYNLKDFGAVGDGRTDNTIAFKSAMAFIASRNGGTLQIPEGDFMVGSTVSLPAGLKMQGISAITTLAPTNNQVSGESEPHQTARHESRPVQNRRMRRKYLDSRFGIIRRKRQRNFRHRSPRRIYVVAEFLFRARRFPRF